MRSREIIVGLVIILGAVVVVVGTLFLKGAGFGGEQLELEARVLEVGQLNRGNDVKLRGVRVGTVEEIYVEEGGGAVRVLMSVERDTPLPADAGVVLSPESMFGDWQAEIVSIARFPRYDFLEASDPEVLPGHSLPDISRLTATADEIAADIATITSRIEVAFTEETAENLRAAIDNISRTTEGLADLIQQQAATFQRVAVEVEEAAGEIGAAANTAGRTFARVDTMLGSGQVDSLMANVTATSANLRDASSEMTTLVQDVGQTLERADSTFGRVDRIAARIERGEGSLGRLLVDTTLAVQARGLLDQVSLLLEDIRENPGRYIRLSIF